MMYPKHKSKVEKSASVSVCPEQKFRSVCFKGVAWVSIAALLSQLRRSFTGSQCVLLLHGDFPT